MFAAFCLFLGMLFIPGAMLGKEALTRGICIMFAILLFGLFMVQAVGSPCPNPETGIESPCQRG